MSHVVGSCNSVAATQDYLSKGIVPEQGAANLDKQKGAMREGLPNSIAPWFLT